jgi:hypothetical protein
VSQWKPSETAKERGMEAWRAAREETGCVMVRDVMVHLNRSREYTADVLRALVQDGRLVTARDIDEPGSPFVYMEPE